VRGNDRCPDDDCSDREQDPGHTETSAGRHHPTPPRSQRTWRSFLPPAADSKRYSRLVVDTERRMRTPGVARTGMLYRSPVDNPTQP
jgi:hypothetical protein